MTEKQVQMQAEINKLLEVVASMTPEEKRQFKDSLGLGQVPSS